MVTFYFFGCWFTVTFYSWSLDRTVKHTDICKNPDLKPIEKVSRLEIPFLPKSCLFSIQHQFGPMKGKCGVCGDAFDAKPKLHEAPGGKYANGIIARKYKAGQMSFYAIKFSSNAMTEVYPCGSLTPAA